MFLNCHSYHSLRYGTIPVEGLVQLGVKNGVEAMALTDLCAVTGIYRFYDECLKNFIKPIVGMEFREGKRLLYIGLAKTATGLAEMNLFLTQHNFDKTLLAERAPQFKSVVIIYPLDNAPEFLEDFEYIGLRPQELLQLYRREWKDRIDRMCILQPVTFRKNDQRPIPKKDKEDGESKNIREIEENVETEYKLHQILRAIDNNTLISKLSENDCCGESEVMYPISELLFQFREFPGIISNTKSIVDQCNFKFALGTPKTKKHFRGSYESDIKILRRLTYRGMKRRYGVDNQQAKDRIKSELKVIEERNFCAYFLITWDIVRESSKRGFMHIGRGSGANSIVSYCMGITDICPLELDLYFERFLNLNRESPPDFDIDWSWKDRDEMLGYIFEKYKGHVAFTGTIAEFKYRSIFRELGKAFGLPKEEIDKLAAQPIIKDDRDDVIAQVYRYGKILERYPNQRSMHACGVLISEEPIINYSPLEMPPKGFPIVQFDMYISEDVGLEKFDILSQRGIGHINDTVKLIEQNRAIKINIRDTSISKDEAKANEFLSVGKTIGCFYIESPAMRGLLRRLKCDNYKVLVAASSIIRPGVAQSGMMREYIFRHNHPDKFEYFHEVFKQHLGETYGIMVYQEDVIKIALHFGGLPAIDGDRLRRAMNGKAITKGELDDLRKRFMQSCHDQGHSERLSEEVYRQISSFAGFSFCKAHSASYAVESYQSLWLKVYYPVEFMVAVINNQGGFYRTEVYIHEARRSGGTIHNPCVNKSVYETTLYGADIYLGLFHIQGLEASAAQSIPEERLTSGDFLSLEDFLERLPLSLETMQILIFIGAFRFTGKEKNELILRARMLLSKSRPETRGPMLISGPAKEFHIPKLARLPFEDAFDEIELIGFPISYTPFNLLKTTYRGDVMARHLIHHHKKTVRMLAYLISRKHVPTKLGAMYFGTWIDVDGDYFDTAHFTDSLSKFPFNGGGCYLLEGSVEVDYHFPTITITRMARLPFIPDPRYEHALSHSSRTERQLQEDISMTNRLPYPQAHEINLPRHKMN